MGQGKKKSEFKGTYEKFKPKRKGDKRGKKYDPNKPWKR